jgi:sodium-dependent phosphate cotransporter
MPGNSAPANGPSDMWSGLLFRVAALALGLLGFVVALELLKRGAAGYGGQLIGILRVGSPAAALGLGWLLAYVFLSGSPVAALAVSLFAAGTLDAPQTLLMITGSRLGASMVVLVTGVVYWLRGRHSRDGVAVGVLALLTTAAIYLPAMLLAYWLVVAGHIAMPDMAAAAPLASFLDPVVELLAGVIAAHLPPWALLVAGVAVLLGAFALLDRALPDIHHESPAMRRAGRLARSPLWMFLLGAAVTSVTLSVSVSVAALVPLAARGVVRKERAVPYIMGANITTFVDTLVAALIVAGPAAFAIVLVEMGAVTVVSLAVLLLAYHRLELLLIHLQEGVMADWRAMALFVAALFCVPLALMMM